jgi:undecaprenyl diphosphate synthase
MAREELLGGIPAGSPDEARANEVDFDRLPSHVAIIMDGNGRWAAQRNLPRVQGHHAGIAAVRDTVETAARLGIHVLTLYAFSMENWKRPRLEVSTLMALLKRYLKLELKTLLAQNIRFGVIGRMEGLSPDVQTQLRKGMAATAGCAGMRFNIALNYGGRAEIVDAARRLIESGVDPATVDEEMFAQYLYTAGQPDPDLLIRTSGELRVSNFLLWQIAYAEIWVTDVLWPDFRRQHLLDAILDFQKRDRRYGGIRPHTRADAAL